MDTIQITRDILEVGKIHLQVVDSSTGAVSLFVGTTRDNFGGKKVVQLEYEAYEPMAKKKLEQLCNRIRLKWDSIHHIALYHRLGIVGPTEASVVVAISSPHRKDSLEAVSFAIDDLKANVPIWKKEWYEDGSTWKENKECSWAAVDNVDPSLVQIHASDDEIERRMNAFIERKRQEVDAANSLEFCSRHESDEPNEFSCARADSVVVPKKDSKSHLRKSKVENLLGPIPKEGIEERVESLEEHLSITKPVPKDFYARLKDIEERVLFLEGVSPEYFNVGHAVTDQASAMEETKQQREYKALLSNSLSTINKRIQELQTKLIK